MKRQKIVRPYCDRMSERERRDIVTALRNIVFLEDDETGEEYCEVNDILDALDVHTEVDWTLGRDEVERLIDMVSVPQTGPRISDEERHEVAEELRRQAAYSSGSLGEWWQRLQEIVTGEVDFANPQETYRAIADLIDRPSENIERPR